MLGKAVARSLSRANLTIYVLATLAAVLAGPFNTGQTLPLPARTIYWGVLLAVSIFCASVVEEGFARFSPQLAGWKLTLAETFGMTALFSPVVFGWTHAMVPPPGGVSSSFDSFVVKVAVLSGIIFATRRLIVEPRRSGVAEVSGTGDAVGEVGDEAGDEAGTGDRADPVPVIRAPRLMRRLPEADAGPVLHIEAQDHFVAILTPWGAHRLRMRFADAVAEMDRVEGGVCHRSHWVLKAAVTGGERRNGRSFLLLANGARVPVSRKHRLDLEAAGLL